MHYQTIFPKSGVWYHVLNLMDIPEIEKYLIENYDKKRIEAITICGKITPPDMRKWTFYNRHKIKVFVIFLRNNLWNGLKLRMRAKQ